ncbi:ribokinase [Roseococcus sp. SYP-B2431]|uniref:ribokinase n=1 Tax=Roseococcus sp. SYP-B2431 TaxID=2496640 RepID=UPI001F0D530B|nr:ribokinase [Roseococcus sp. SYP-B2431]
MTLIVFGSAIADLVFRVPHLPRPGETVLGEAGAALPGGKGLNQAIAAARDGGDARFVGCVGRDAHGALLRAAALAAGVDVVGLREVEEGSGFACVCVDAEGRNQIAVSAGANRRASAAQVERIPPEATLLMQMEVPPAANAALIARGRAAGARMLLNLAPAAALAPDALRALDLLILNESEAAWIGGRLGQPGDARSLHAALGIGVAVTEGERGVTAVTGEGVLRLPAHRVAVVDTVGAGDAWCGVLAAALDRGLPLEAAMRRASAAGSLACTKPGAAPAMPTAAEIDALLSRS